MPALDTAITSYYATADLEAGVQPVPVGPAPPQPPDEWAGTSNFWPNAADSRECGDGDSELDMLVIDGDDRTGFASPVTHTQSSLLHIRISVNGGPGWACSGVKVSSRHLLTNAHCVADDGGNRLPNLSVDVCSNQTSAASTCQTFQGEAGNIIVSPEYSPGSSFGLGDGGDDWALLVMPGGLPDPKMYLADDAIGRNEIKRLDAERVGHDSWKATATSSGCIAINHQTYEPATAVSGTNRGTVRFKGDVANGGSGGPYYVVPSGLTAGRIIGLQSGSRSGTINTQYGPRVTEFREFVIAAIED